MKKIVKKLGNSYGVYLNADDRKIYNIDKDDIIEFTIIKVSKREDIIKSRRKK